MKRKALVSKKKKNNNNIANVIPTKWWTFAHDDVLIHFLTNMAKSGFKPDKNSKQYAFCMTAIEVNNRFRTTFTTKSVVNHMKTDCGWFHDMQSACNLSGADWDEKTETISIDPDSFDRWNEDKNKSKLKNYINKPLKHYENLAAICGDDWDRGKFSKASMEKFGGRRRINLADYVHNDDSIPMTQKSPQVANLDEEDTQCQSNNNANAPIHDN